MERHWRDVVDARTRRVKVLKMGYLVRQGYELRGTYSFVVSVRLWKEL